MKFSLTVIYVLISSGFCFSQTIEEIKDRIASIDSINRRIHQNVIQLMKNNENQIFKFDQAEFNAGNAITTYSILLDQNNTVLTFSIKPYSESGDWFKQHLYYFSDDGKVLSYINTLRFVNGLCIDGVLVSTKSFFYDYNSNIIDAKTTLEDHSGNDLSGQDCVMQYANPLKRYKILTDLLTSEGIEKIW